MSMVVTVSEMLFVCVGVGGMWHDVVRVYI